MNINFKKPISFVAFFLVIQITVSAIFHYLLPSNNVLSISMSISLLIYALVYSLYFKVKLSQQFKDLASKYLTIIIFTSYLLYQALNFYLSKPSVLDGLWPEVSGTKVAATIPPVLTFIVLISLYIFITAMTYIFNYFLIYVGNWLAVLLLKDKRITEI